MLENVALAVVDHTNVGKEQYGGLLGLGWDNQETDHVGDTVKYPNLVDLPYSQVTFRATHTACTWMTLVRLPQCDAECVLIPPAESGSGSILFGGYDIAKYSGPQIPLSAGTVSTDVPLQAISITDASGSTTEVGFYEGTVPAILDCGTPFTASLPNYTYRR